MNNEIEPQQQADGYSLDEITGEQELVEELAATVTIEKLLDTFIEEVTEILAAINEVSLDGNAVRTHLELVNGSQDIVELAYELRGDLVRNVANRAEAITEQNFGATQIAAATHASELRKQVIPEEEN